MENYLFNMPSVSFKMLNYKAPKEYGEMSLEAEEDTQSKKQPRLFLATSAQLKWYFLILNQ